MKRKIFSVLFALVLLVSMSLVTAVPVGAANPTTIASSTMVFQSVPASGDIPEYTLTYDPVTGTYSGMIPMVQNEVGVGDGVPGYDVYARNGDTAWFGDDPGTVVWTDVTIADHDAWSTWDVDTPDWYQYSLRFYEEEGVQKWRVANHSGATLAVPWASGGGSAGVEQGVPMSGTMNWSIMYAAETDVGEYLLPLDVNHGEIPGGAATQGGGAACWDMDWSWGSEVIPLAFPGFDVEVTEDGGVYTVTLTPAAGPVTNTNTSLTYGTIQLAIDDAQPNDTINVAAGTYAEHLTITAKSNLTIQSTEDAEIVPTSTPWKTPIIKVDNSTDITIRGLVIDGKNEVDPSSYSWGGTPTGVGILFINSSGTIESNEIRNFNLNSYPVERRFKPVGTGIIVLYDCPQVTIEGNDIRSYHASGIRLCYGFEANIINIIDNVITGRGPQSYYSGESIRIDAASTVNIIGNELRDNIYNNEHGAEGDAAGVTICGAHGGPPVVNITENDILNNTFGIIVEKAEGAVVEAHFNNIVGNGVHGTAPNRGGAAAQDVLAGHGDPDVWPINTTLNATNNWWGDPSGPIHVGTNPLGTGDAVSGNVTFSPWLGAGVEDSKSEETEAGDDIVVDATDEADTEVVKSGTGTPTITVAKYSDNPGRGFAGSTGKYIDVHVDNPAGVTEIEIRVYYTNAEIAGLVESSLILRWWDGTRWIGCSDSGVNTTDILPYSGYIWAKIRNDTIPTLDQLSGTVFGGSGRAPIAPPPPPAPVPPPGTTDVRGKVSTAGVFTRSVNAISEDGLCTLTILEGTVGLTEELEPLTEITIVIMDEPPPPPEAAHVIGLVYDLEPDGAIFDPPITLTFSYDPADIPEGIAEEDLVLAFYDQAAGEWVVLEGVVDPVANTITAPVAHFTTFGAMVFIPVPATFSLSGLEVSPAEVEIGSSVTISAVAENTGGEEGTCEVTLEINGKVEVTKEVALEPGASETVTFTTSRDVAGSYSVDVNGLTGSFAVKAPPELPPEEAPPEEVPPEVKPINWPLVGGLIAAVVVVVGLLFFFLVRRRRAY